MEWIFTCGNIMLSRKKGNKNAITISFPNAPSDEMLKKILVCAANLAMDEGMDIYRQEDGA